MVDSIVEKINLFQATPSFLNNREVYCAFLGTFGAS